MGFPLFSPSILGYPYFWKHPYWIWMGGGQTWENIWISCIYMLPPAKTLLKHTFLVWTMIRNMWGGVMLACVALKHMVHAKQTWCGAGHTNGHTKHLTKRPHGSQWKTHATSPVQLHVSPWNNLVPRPHIRLANFLWFCQGTINRQPIISYVYRHANTCIGLPYRRKFK